MSLDLSRPGSDPLRPHQDLRIPSRIPSQYLSQVLPSSSSTPPVAVQIASLHRASEVARFEWRAAQRARQAGLHRNSTSVPPSTFDNSTAPRYETAASSSSSSFSRPSLMIPATSTAVPQLREPSSQQMTSSSLSLEAAQARDARMSSRVFSSVSEAYHFAVTDLNRHTSVDLLDVSDGDEDGDDNGNNEDVDHASETSGDSTNTESEITAYTMATATRTTRNVGVGSNRSYSSALTGLPDEDNLVVESQVWDRMVNDLAVGAGITGLSRDPVYTSANDVGPLAHQRGVSNGIATSMLALSAAIPRPESQRISSGSHGSTAIAPPRLLLHPIWARRYPGGAGEWLRGELARRASASSTQSISTQTSTSIPRPAAHAPRWRSTSTAQWEDSTTSTSNQSLVGTDTSIYDLFSDRNRINGARRTSNWDWNVLRFPSLDPSSRERRSGNDQAPNANVQGTDETTSLTLPSSSTITRSLAVPADNRASLPTPPPPPPAADISFSESRSRQNEENVNTSISSEILPVGTRGEISASTTNVEATNLVARMARASRQTAAARSAAGVTSGTTPEEGASAISMSNSRASRATHSGMSYIRRLRQLDGLTEMQSHTLESDVEDVPSRSPPRSYEVFPWYQPPTSEAASYPLTAVESIDDDDEEDLSNPDPDGTNVHWYEMARERMAAQNSYALQEVNDDPDGDRIEDEIEHSRHTLGVRRRVVAGTSGGASQRNRNRSALVVAAGGSTQDSNSAQRDVRSESWNAVDGWTLVDQRPLSPVRRSRDEGSENVTTWLREPAQPLGRFSTSPQQMNASISSPNLRPSTTRTIHSYRPVPASEDPRMTRRPRRMASLVDSEIAPYSESRVAREDTPSPELLSTEAVSSNTGNNNSSVLGRARQLTSIGRRLEEEFRARQGELRQREERLRSEVARRRMELDQVRRRQGRIGRVIDRTRHQTIEGAEAVTTTININEMNEEVMPLLGEQESSLIRRSALREPRRVTLESPSSSTQTVESETATVTTLRDAPPTPLQEILARISLNSSRMYSGAERSLRRTSSWSASTSTSLPELLRVTSLDDYHTLR